MWWGSFGYVNALSLWCCHWLVLSIDVVFALMLIYVFGLRWAGFDFVGVVEC